MTAHVVVNMPTRLRDGVLTLEAAVLTITVETPDGQRHELVNPKARARHSAGIR